MRLWSFHPKYLDPVGLTRCINEGLGGYRALTGQQQMWKNHSQLTRFKHTDNPEKVLSTYLMYLFEYKSFTLFKQIDKNFCFGYTPVLLEVTKGQVEYEWKHYLNNKLKKRNVELYNQYKDLDVNTLELHPIFKYI